MERVAENEGAFGTEEYSGRIERVRAQMRARDLGALAITTPENIYYLVGLNHQGYFAFTMLVLPLEGEPLLVTRAMEQVVISAQTTGIGFRGYSEDEDAGDAATRAIEAAGCAGERVGIDTSSMFFPPGVWEAMEQGLPGVEWIDTSRTSSVDPSFRAGLVDNVRLVKTDAEIACVRRAAAVSDRAVRAGLAAAGVGVNETEVAAAIYDAMVHGGGEYPGFVPFIRSTETLQEEHTTWRNHVLTAGEQLFIELSGSYARYHAPLGRMGHIARAPQGSERLRAVAVGAIEAARDALRPGVVSGDVYASWQAAVDEGLGHSRLRRHHCGYNVGIGFPPSWVGSSTVLGLRPGGRVPIEQNMVFHLWAWIHDEDVGDYLLSDSAVVTEGGAELLTTTPRPLVVD
ncbi:MAG: Ectoine hydrolase [Acidimicrobiaceae bacterium]|nr:Ectoine hydrolase [Acidimicrobiaceae bacterium]